MRWLSLASLQACSPASYDRPLHHAQPALSVRLLLPHPITTLPLQASCSLTRVAHPQTRGIAWRDVDRVEFRSPELSAAVWAAISGSLTEGLPRTARGEVPAGLNAKWRVYRCAMRVS